MWDVVGLAGVCVAMALGTYVIGTLPLFFQLSRNGLRMLELWGSGLLLGAALTVVIPEGIASVYKGSNLCRDGEPVRESNTHLTSKDLIAACLLSGFLLMFIVDRQMMAKMQRRGTHAHAHHHVSDLEQTDDDVPWYSIDEEQNNGWLPSSTNFLGALSSLLGLIIHALADGIALGASVDSPDSSLRIVVVLAIMVHKAPASIGTCTLLMSLQLSRTDIRWAILVFSLATPVGAISTYAAIQFVFRITGGAEATINARDIGAILSFSGGTFLYVAMHAVLELTADAGEGAHASGHSHHPLDHDHPIHARTMSPAPRVSGMRVQMPSQDVTLSHRTTHCLSLVVLGSITPRLLQLMLGDSHGHVE